MSGKKSNNYRTIEEKYRIIKYFESLQKKGAKTATIKQFNISAISTLDGIMTKKYEIIHSFEAGLASKNRKSLKQGHNQDIDQRVYDWICWMRSKTYKFLLLRSYKKGMIWLVMIIYNPMQPMAGFEDFKRGSILKE